MVKGYFTVVENRVYVLRSGANSAILEIDPDTKRSRALYTFPYPIEPTYTIQAIAISPVTREAFVQHRVREDSDLVLVENFP